jgi:hypothetical protein
MRVLRPRPALRRGRLTVAVRSATRCVGQVTLLIAGRTLRSRSLVLQPGMTARIALRIPRGLGSAVRKRMSRRGHVDIRVRVRVVDAAGSVTVARREIRMHRRDAAKPAHASSMGVRG